MTDFENKNVVIIGNPCAGKTTFYNENKYRFGNHVCFHTDDFMGFGYEQSLYELMRRVVLEVDGGRFVVVEGIAGFRLLRKGLELRCFYPDVVIKINVSLDIQAQRYSKRNLSEIKPGVLAMNKANETVFKTYLGMDNPRNPEIIIIDQN